MEKEINVCLGIDSKSAPDVESECRLTVEKNKEFPLVLVGLPHEDVPFLLILDRINKNIALSRNGDRAATVKVKEDVKTCRLFHRENALFVQGVARTAVDAALPVKMGYKLFKDRAANKKIGFRLTQKGSGEVFSEIDAVPGANAYVWMYLHDGKWIFAEATVKCEYLYKALPTLVDLIFRYAPVTSNGQGEFVESARFIAT